MLAPIKGLFLGPDAPTKASFIDSLEASAKVSTNGSGMTIFSAMTVLCEEFGVLIPKYDDSFLATLSKLYDNGPIHTEPRRSVKSSRIENPTVNILAAATPAALSTFPEAAWGEGFTSRVVFVYGTTPEVYRDMFAKRPESDIESLQKELDRLFNELHGPFEWEDEAQDAIRHWFNDEKLAPTPTYGRLVNYLGRRNEHTMKLSMISAVSAGNGLTVTLSDFLRGRQWLLDAEEMMPDVFRAMKQKSDTQLIQDMHQAMWQEYAKIARDKRVDMDESWMWNYLREKVTSDKIKTIITAAEKSGLIRPSGLLPGKWAPAPIDLATGGTKERT